MTVFLKTCIVYNVLTHCEQVPSKPAVDLSMRWAGPAWPGVDLAHCYNQQASGPLGAAFYIACF
jgi:hypothetical protein